MHYQISRNGQMYGPYTLEDLQRYVATGNVLGTDLAKSEAMSSWIPVSQILAGTATPPPATPGYSTPGFAPSGYAEVPTQQAIVVGAYPDAPNIHWGLYLLLTVITCTLFSKVFIVFQAAWLKRVQPNSKGLMLYIVMYAVWLAGLFVGFGSAMTMMAHPGTLPVGSLGARGLLTSVYFILLFATRIVMSMSLQEHFSGPEPVPVRFDTVLAFFFGGIYFQAKLNEVNALKQAARYGAGIAGSY
jgi:hypothetical protein